MTHIFVGPLSAVHETVDAAGVSHLVTLMSDQLMIETPGVIEDGKHLRLAMNDISEPRPDMVLPGESHVAELIDFARRWDRSAPMLIHCWAGISRSTAAAFISLCALNPDTEEARIAREIRAASPTATPNRRLVEVADGVLERRGRMASAVAAIGRGAFTSEGTVFRLPARLPA